MKTKPFLFIVLILTLFSGCKTETDPEALLENTETRKEIMTAISGNHGYMMELMNIMSDSEHAMQMMSGNEELMGRMMQGNGMQMMGQDSMMMHGMMQKMMKNGQMMGHMMQMMHKEGMMSEECMQSFMDMMAAEGMDMKGMGKMNGGSMRSDEEDH